MLLLRTLLKISYAFSTAPYYDFTLKKTRKLKLYTLYSSCTLLMITAGFLYSSIFIKKGARPGESQVQQIGNLLETLSSLLLAVAALTAVSGAVFMRKKWQRLLEQLQNINVKLGIWEKDSANVYFKLFLMLLPKVCKDVYCIYAYSTTSFASMPKYFICNTVFDYYCFVPTLLVISLAFILKSKYKMLMELLKRRERGISISENNIFLTNELLTHKTTFGGYLRGISKLFRLLNSILDNYNAIFGYQLLFMLGHTLLSVLQTFDYCLKYRETGFDSTDVLFANLCMTAFNLVRKHF